MKADSLNYKQVKQCIQSFIYGVNTPSRWGCVDTETEVLSTSGFKRYDELKEGDEIYTWKDGKLRLNRVNKVVVKPFKGKLHSYKAPGYHQLVTPTHRMLARTNGGEPFGIKHSEEIFSKKGAPMLPTAFFGSDLPDVPLSDLEIQLAAVYYAAGGQEYVNEAFEDVSIVQPSKKSARMFIEQVLNDCRLPFKTKTEGDPFHEKQTLYLVLEPDAKTILKITASEHGRIAPMFLRMSQRQAKLFLEAWASASGYADKEVLKCPAGEIADALQQICLLAGWTSFFGEEKGESCVYIRRQEDIIPSSREEVKYDGLVWCPNVDNGTAVFRKDGCVFISGQTQAPFTNVTLDWTVPPDLADQYAIVGGKEMPFKYKDCKKEMDMINKAFIEIMIEGDANGRGFQYPIPTYSITKDFDWSETENNKLLFEMTAKYGTPYFSNYVNSDMEPSDVRSMCPLFGREPVLVMNSYGNQFALSTVENLYKGHNRDHVYTVLLNGQTKQARLNRFDGLSFLKVRTVNGHEIVLSTNHANLVMTEDGERAVLRTDELCPKHYLPFSIKPYTGENSLTYEDGLMVGAFMGDGSVKDDYAVVYSLNDTSKAELMANLIRIGQQKFGGRIRVTECGENCVNLTVTSKMLRGLIDTFVAGKGTEKELLANCINHSLDFRKGVIEGLLLTDGNKTSNRIYTSSPKAVTGITAVLASVGIPTNLRIDDRKGTDGKFSDNPVYVIRMYKPDTCQPSYGDVYRKDNDYMWFRIASVEPVNSSAGIGYCFEVLNDEEPYFMLPSGLVTHNCRLRLDLRELRKKSGGFFGSGESTGSVGVVTINMPRIAYLSKSEAEFYKRLDHMMDIAARSLKIKRDVITKFMENGLYPYTKRYLGTFKNHFSTIGLVGMNEACLNACWLRENIGQPKAQQFAKDVLNHMRDRLVMYQEQYGDLYNLEATPAESTTYRLAKHDAARYPDIITAAKDGGTPFYTNSSHLPVDFTSDIFEALDLQDGLQTLYTSGTVFHAFLGEKLPNWRSAAVLVRRIAENYKLPYYTLSPTYSVCRNHGYLAGEHFTCPDCGEPAEVYSRITGYYRPVQNWNDGKAEEYKERKLYKPDFALQNTRKESGTNTAVTEEKGQPDLRESPSVENPEQGEIGELLLFTTKTCPNCKMVKAILDKANVPYTVIDAEESPELVEKYDISVAPTLLVKQDGLCWLYQNMTNIRRFLSKLGIQ